MAKIVRLVCDACLLDGKEESGVERNISIEGDRRKPHLCDEHYNEHIKPVADWLDEISGKSKSSAKTSSGSRKKGPRPADVRAWAKTQGIEIGDAGRVPQDLVDRYVAAKAG